MARSHPGRPRDHRVDLAQRRLLHALTEGPIRRGTTAVAETVAVYLHGLVDLTNKYPAHPVERADL